MLKGYLEKTDPLLKLIIFTGLILVFLGLFSMISIPLTAVVFSSDMAELMSSIQRGNTPVGAMKFMQIMAQIGMMLLPSFLAAYLFSQKVSDYLSFRPLKGMTVVVIVVVTIAATPLINVLLEWNSQLHLPAALHRIEEIIRTMEEQADKLTESFLKMNSVSDLIVNLLMIGLLPAIGEEFVFRGIFQKLFLQWTKNAHLAVLISAIIFSAIHMQFLGFIPRFALGILLGYLLVWTGSIWASVAAHFVNNASAVLFSWMEQHGQLAFDQNTFGTEHGQGWWIALSMIIMAIGCIYIHKSSRFRS